MLHLRVVCPAPSTPAVLEVLRAEPGAANVTVHVGTVVQPPGDLVEADVAREAVDAVLRRLRGLGVLEHGSLVLEPIDTALGAEVERAERDAPGQGDDALVWDQLVKAADGGTTSSAAFYSFLVLATLIAGVGLLTDSTVLIVGAMVLGPEFGPLAALAVAVVRRRRDLVPGPLRALGLGFPLAIALTAAAVAGLDAVGLVPEEFVQGRRPLTSFVASPDAFSVIVALLAGVAGTLSLTAGKSGPLVGVFISVTTVPAAADVAAGLVTGQTGTALGAAVQLVVNLSCILLAGVLTLLVQRTYWRRVHRDGRPVPVRVP
ncbi:DUF389 domain-containing protein [Kineococcus gypseus]|uniref:DUF389 domain-containing protein n=1 Tax=Kineococcus gypseus TaxID=1637102 RepID=UPI003D7E079C